MRSVLSEKAVNLVGEQSRFSQRLRKLTPARALWTFVAGLASGKINTIADLVRLFLDLTGIPIAYKAFHDRLSHPAFPEFFRSTFEMAMAGLSQRIQKGRSRYLRRFADILIQDGSSFALNDALSSEFPGRFTRISPAAAEVHCTYSLYEGQANCIAVAPDKEAERPFLPTPEEVRGKLLLADRGYTCYEYCDAVKSEGGDFIGRVRDKNFNPTIVKCFRGFSDKRGLVGKKLKDIRLPKSNVDLLIRGRDPHGVQHQVRLVLYYVVRKDIHIFLITTLSAHDHPPSVVASLYRLRWQVELFFKECKSYTNLQKFQTKNPHIVEGLIWASMLALLIRRFLLYSAFRRTGVRTAPFIAAAMSWTFFRDLARVAVHRFRGLTQALSRILEFLRHAAARTNKHRKSTFDVFEIVPVRGWS
jgi:hypothetical protein